MPLPARSYRWLFLPIETKVRELDGKLLLAATAAERGWGVIIGHKDELAANTADIRGVVLEKDGNLGNRRIGKYREAGKLVCALDEEGLVYLNSDDYFRRRLSEGSLQRLELFFLWGDVQRRDILEHVRGIEGTLALTGNPRFDLLRPGLRNYYTLEAGRLRDEFGPFILVNTNFADSNHFMGTEWVIQNHRNNGFITSGRQEAVERAFIAYQESIVGRFVAMVRELSLHYPEYTVIVRPHPSENHEKWAALGRTLKNLRVIHEGDVNPWLLAADVAIHNSCMTGIHGFLLERPTISYMPVKSERFDYYLPNVLSTVTETLSELFSAVDRVVRDPNSGDPAQRDHQMTIAERYITAINGPLASDRIMEALERLTIEPDTYKATGPGRGDGESGGTDGGSQPGLMGRIARSIAAKPRRTLAAVADRKHRAYSKQKYPGMALAEIEAKISALRAASVRFGAVEVRQHGNQSFCIVSQAGA